MNKVDAEAPPGKRSFALRGGKKIYEGYNAERKVVGRKRKEKQRLGYEAFAGDFNRANNELPGEYVDKIIVGDSGGVFQFSSQCVA